MPKLNKMRQQIADTFIQSLKEDVIPWHRSWHIVGVGMPYNAVTEKEYRGINALWLLYLSLQKGVSDPRWCTFRQANEKGWRIRKGEKGTQIEFWSLYDTEEKKKLSPSEVKSLRDSLTDLEFSERVKPISNVYTVFNGEQIDGIPELEKMELVPKFDTEQLIKCRDTLLKNMKLGFEEKGNRAAYSPSLDCIRMPKIEQFKSSYGYMSVFLHESAHATGAKHRLNRDLTGAFGSETYAKEELRAEIASAFTAMATGISYEQSPAMENHTAYIQSWIKVLENNPNELFAAIKEAEKISDYLIKNGEFLTEREELSENEQFFKDCDISALLAKSTLAWDEIESLGYIFFENGYIDKYKPSDSCIFGNGLKEPDVYRLAERRRSGEDISKELAVGLFGTKTTVDEIPVNGSYSNHIELTIVQSDNGLSLSYGSITREITYQQLANSYLTLFENEYKKIVFENEQEEIGAFKQKNDNRYKIYQFKSGEENHCKRFMSLSNQPEPVNIADYQLVYEGSLIDIDGDDKLEGIFKKFNIDHPDDFKGHSLSVSDVIVTDVDGKKTAYFCDSFGYTEIPDFYKAKTVPQKKINDYRYCTADEKQAEALQDSKLDDIEIRKHPKKDGEYIIQYPSDKQQQIQNILNTAAQNNMKL